MLAYARKRAAALVADRALAIYGALLAATQLLTVAWMIQYRVWQLLARGSPVICWPMLPGCDPWRVLSPLQIQLLMGLSALLAIAAGAAFLRRKTASWWLLALNQLFQVAIIAQDFQLRRNQHYMLTLVVLATLLLPEPKRAVRYLIVLFYVAAGTLKLNREWLTGAALYGPVPVSGWPLQVACGYVVLLELVLIWGLLSTHKRIFQAVLIQVALFELASLPIVGFFYPVLMVLMLGLFWTARDESERPLRFFPESLATQLFLLVFALLQVVPHLFPGDTAITGEGRLFALHMFDAKIVCSSEARVRRGDEVVRVYDLNIGLPIRIACDPAVLIARGETVCKTLPGLPFHVDLSLESRRSSEPALRKIVSLTDVCGRLPDYKWWRHNDWIAVY